MVTRSSVRQLSLTTELQVEEEDCYGIFCNFGSSRDTASPVEKSDGGARALVPMGDARRRLAPPLLPDDQPTPPLGLALRTAALTGPQPSPAHRQPPGPARGQPPPHGARRPRHAPRPGHQGHPRARCRWTCQTRSFIANVSLAASTPCPT